MLKKVLFFALLPLLLSAAMPEKPFVLARNGKAACQIVLSEKANKFDKMAAKDLQYYLGKITGAKYSIVSEKQAKGNAVYVGNTSAGKKYAPDCVLMVGDAPGDYKAAAKNNALFFPIIPGKEEDSWAELLNNGLDKFFNKEFAGAYQKQLLDAFEASLPEKPCWEK